MNEWSPKYLTQGNSRTGAEIPKDSPFICKSLKGEMNEFSNHFFSMSL